MPADRMRASDAERDETVALLGEAATEGRLDLDELDARTAAAFAAKTRGELVRLLADIPHAQLTLPRPEPRWRGPFSAQWRAPVPREQAVSELLKFVGVSLRAHGYDLEQAAEGRVVFARKRPRWWVQRIRFLLPGETRARLRKREAVTFELHDHDQVTVIRASGQAPREVRRALSALER